MRARSGPAPSTLSNRLSPPGPNVLKFYFDIRGTKWSNTLKITISISPFV